MTTLLALVFGVLSGTLLSVLVGMVGSRRRIGFGWAFLASLLLTPMIGLLITLLTDPLPDREQRWGCLGVLLALFGALSLVLFLVVLLGGVSLLAFL